MKWRVPRRCGGGFKYCVWCRGLGGLRRRQCIPGWCYPTGRCAYLPSVTCCRQSIKPPPLPPPPPPPLSLSLSLSLVFCFSVPVCDLLIQRRRCTPSPFSPSTPLTLSTPSQAFFLSLSLSLSLSAALARARSPSLPPSLSLSIPPSLPPSLPQGNSLSHPLAPLPPAP